MLVAAIEKATGKPLNVVIPSDDGDVTIPPLKMNHVDVSQLFDALAGASQKNVNIKNGPFDSTVSINYGFATSANTVADDSIWFFYAHKLNQPSPPPDAISWSFYSLRPYLDRGFTVDDITTAIRTGWQMLGKGQDNAPEPQLSFHKETSLLIAVGNAQQISMVAQALSVLPATTVSVNDIQKIKDDISGLFSNITRLDARLNNPTAKVETLPGTAPGHNTSQ